MRRFRKKYRQPSLGCLWVVMNNLVVLKVACIFRSQFHG